MAEMTDTSASNGASDEATLHVQADVVAEPGPRGEQGLPGKQGVTGKPGPGGQKGEPGDR